MYRVDASKCIGCGVCVASCSQGAPRLEGDVAVIDPDLCIECGTCATLCPQEAIGEVGAEMDVVVHESQVQGVQKTPPRTSKLLISGKNAGARHLSLGLNETAVGSRIPEHVHPEQEEAMFILSGRGKFRILGAEYDVGPGTALFAPPGVPHELVNTGDEPIRLVWCYAPPLPEHRSS